MVTTKYKSHKILILDFIFFNYLKEKLFIFCFVCVKDMKDLLVFRTRLMYHIIIKDHTYSSLDYIHLLIFGQLIILCTKSTPNNIILK